MEERLKNSLEQEMAWRAQQFERASAGGGVWPAGAWRRMSLANAGRNRVTAEQVCDELEMGALSDSVAPAKKRMASIQRSACAGCGSAKQSQYSSTASGRRISNVWPAARAASRLDARRGFCGGGAGSAPP